MAAERSVWREGSVAGLLGAGGVAAWFFAVDLLEGHPLYTPSLLGKAMLSILGHGINQGPLFNAAAYTVFHVLAFVGVGVLASKLVSVSRTVPQISVGFVIFFAVFETAFYFLTAMLSQADIVGALAWYHIGAANLVASALMGGFLGVRHPDLAQTFRQSLEGSV